MLYELCKDTYCKLQFVGILSPSIRTSMFNSNDTKTSISLLPVFVTYAIIGIFISVFFFDFALSSKSEIEVVNILIGACYQFSALIEFSNIVFSILFAVIGCVAGFPSLVLEKLESVFSKRN